MTKKFNSRLVEWVNELGQDRLKEMKALKKRKADEFDALFAAIDYRNLQTDFGCNDYEFAKSQFDGQISCLKKLPTKTCPFCNGTMVDNSDAITLKPYMNSFWLPESRGVYRACSDVNDWLGNFAWSCYDCETIETHPPKETAKVWLNTSEIRKKKIFASSIFRQFLEVEAVSLEGAMGRGWLIKYDQNWYSNYKVKGELVKVWGV